ncbi:MAG: PQQ-binding-like beta-propeller repeat protein [Candidatus Bathyarchaeia archaeon]
MKRKITSLIMVILLTVSVFDFMAIIFIRLVVSSGGGSTDWWLMFRHDISHTGYSTELAPTRKDTAPAWVHLTGGAVYSSPAVANGIVFVGSSDGKLYAFDFEGGPKWKTVFLGGPLHSSPAFDGGIIFIGSSNGSIYAIDANSGSVKWNVPTIAVYSSPTVVDGVVFIGSDDGNLYAINANNGSIIRQFPAGFPVRSSPAIANGRILFGADDGRIYALNASTFRYLWHFETYHSVRSSPAVADGLVFVGSLNGTVYALNETDGSEVWRFNTDGPVHSSPAVAYGKVFVGSNDTNIYALDEFSGGLIWSFTTGGEVCSSPAVANSTVFVGSMDSQVYALNEADGSIRWNYTTGGAVWSSPAIVGKMVFVGSTDIKVYAFKEPNLKPVPIITYKPTYPVVCQSVTFNGSDSYDPDGYIIKWRWQLGDGTIKEGKVVTHNYNRAGNYIVNLTVTDNVGESNFTLQPISVLEAWPMFRHDSTHAAYSTSLAPVTSTVSWFNQIGQPSLDDGLWSSPIVVDGYIYCASREGYVYKFNASDGSLISPWPVKPGGEIRSSPAYYNGMIFVGSLDGYVYALNATSGEIASKSAKFGGIESSPVVSDEMVFVGSQDNYVHALYLNLTQKWVSTDTGGDIVSSPAVFGGIIFVGSDGKKIAALNKTTGETIWSKTLNDWVRSSPAVAYGRIFVGGDDGYIYAFNIVNGNFEWKYRIGSVIRSSPAIAGGKVFIGSDDGNLYVLNATTTNPNGEKLWNVTIGSIRWSSPAVAEGKVFIGTTEGKVFALREKDGKILWSYTTSGAIDSSPVILDDTLYISSKDGNLYAFREQVHDIAVTSVISPKRVVQNETIIITTIIENQGSFNETNVSITAQYHDVVLNHTSININRGKELTLQIPWNTTGLNTGNYTIYVNATLPPPLIDNEPTDNTMHINVTIESGVHNVKITEVTPLKTVVGQGYRMNINVTVANQGDFTETFNVTVHANTTEIEAKEITLESGASATLTFTWNTTGFAKGNYTIWAYAWPVQGETDTSDNTFDDRIVLVNIAGDVSSHVPGVPDYIVNSRDVTYLILLFNTRPWSPNWNPNADINNDNVVNARDITIAVINFMKTFNDP